MKILLLCVVGALCIVCDTAVAQDAAASRAGPGVAHGHRPAPRHADRPRRPHRPRHGYTNGRNSVELYGHLDLESLFFARDPDERRRDINRWQKRSVYISSTGGPGKIVATTRRAPPE